MPPWNIEPDPARLPFRPGVRADWPAFRAALAGAGYTRRALERAVGIGAPADPEALTRLLYRGGRLAMLLGLFQLRRDVTEREARAALAPFPLAPLIDAGIVALADGRVSAPAAVAPIDEAHLVFHDFEPTIAGGTPAPDHVMPVTLASLMLSTLTCRNTFERVLDVGTGGGFQAIMAAKHAAHVVATDVNPRALNFAEMARAVCGIDNIEFRRGHLFEPVGREHFDLIVCYAPQAMPPEPQFMFRDSGLPGDDFCRLLVEGAGPRLTEGGFCSIFGQWSCRLGAHWADRPREWSAPTGCDVRLLCMGHDHLIEHARMCNVPPIVPAERAASESRRWQESLMALGTGGITYGLTIMHKRSGGGNWVRSEEPPAQVRLGEAGPQVARTFAAQTTLAATRGPMDLLERRLVLTPHHAMEPHDGGNVMIRQTQGWEFKAVIDARTAALLHRLDGGVTLGDAAREAAAEMGVIFDEETGVALARTIAQLMLSGYITEAPTDQDG